VVRLACESCAAVASSAGMLAVYLLVKDFTAC
jgi:hypothetical protein